MSKEQNIEELFRSTFETFEAPVDPSVWTAIQSGIATQGAASAVTATTTSGIVKTLVISGATLLTGLGLGYVFFGDNEKQPETGKKAVVANNPAPVTEQLTENKTTATESTTPKMVEVVIPVEDKTTGKKEVVTIQVPENTYINKSIVDDVNSEANRERWNKYYEEREKEKQKTTVNTQGNTDKATVDEKTNAKVEVEQVAEDKPMAFITASKEAGTAPLVVQFANTTDEYSYYWEFGDGSVSTENTPEHIYREPGSYTVKLTVKNKAGKSTVGKMNIEVISPMEFTKIPNVFSPNNDGINDEYRVLGNNVKLFTMTIYTKNGDLLFRTNDITAGWNGEDPQGNPMPDGIYLVVIDAIGFDNTPFQKGGSFRLKR